MDRSRKRKLPLPEPAQMEPWRNYFPASSALQDAKLPRYVPNPNVFQIYANSVPTESLLQPRVHRAFPLHVSLLYPTLFFRKLDLKMDFLII